MAVRCFLTRSVKPMSIRRPNCCGCWKTSVSGGLSGCRVGGLRERRVDVRIIAATNQPLEQRVSEGRFRADLLYRLRVIQLEVPSLRQRQRDVVLLARMMLEQFARRYNKPSLTIAPSTLDALARHNWPGNVRELRNLMEQTVLLVRDNVIEVADLALPFSFSQLVGRTATSLNTEIGLEQMERDLVSKALERTGWNVTHAARVLGITRDTLRYRMEKHGLKRSQSTGDLGN